MSEQGRLHYNHEERALHYSQEEMATIPHYQCSWCGSTKQEHHSPECFRAVKAVSSQEIIDKYNATPSYYSSEKGDLYDFFIAQYGYEHWKQHVLMEAIQYLLRANRKGQFREDLQKTIAILNRILIEKEKSDGREH